MDQFVRFFVPYYHDRFRRSILGSGCDSGKGKAGEGEPLQPDGYGKLARILSDKQRLDYPSPTFAETGPIFFGTGP